MTNRDRRRVRSLLLGLALSGVAAYSGPPAADVEQLYVRVEDGGKAVPNLTAKNFRLFEGRRPVVVESAEQAGSASVVLLVENSLASWEFLNEVNSAMKGFMKYAPAAHDYALVSYGKDTKVEATLTKSANQVAAAYAGRKASAWSDVSTYDAIVRVLDELEALDRRAVMIVIGSGTDRFSESTYQQVIDRIERTDVVVYAIRLGASSRRPSAWPAPDPESGRTETAVNRDVPGIDRTGGEMLFRAAAQRTGGEYYCPSCEAGFRTAIEEILDSLGKTYSLAYQRPSNAEGGFVRISVEAFRLDNDVRRDYRAVTRLGRRF